MISRLLVLLESDEDPIANITDLGTEGGSGGSESMHDYFKPRPFRARSISGLYKTITKCKINHCLEKVACGDAFTKSTIRNGRHVTAG